MRSAAINYKFIIDFDLNTKRLIHALHSIKLMPNARKKLDPIDCVPNGT